MLKDETILETEKKDNSSLYFSLQTDSFKCKILSSVTFV